MFCSPCGPTLIDGGLSTALKGNSLNTKLWTGELLRCHQDRIRAAHKSYVDSGAKVIITSSYQVTYPGCLGQGWTKEEIDSAFDRSTELARFDGIKVAASVGPYGAYLANGDEYRGNYGLSKEELKDFHRERLHRLIATSPDLLAVETIPELTEAQAIMELIAESASNIPYWISFTCKNESQIASGETFADAVKLVNELTPNAVAVGINCTAPHLISGLLKSAKSSIPYVVYPNTGRQWDAVNKQWSGNDLSFEPEQISDWIAQGTVLIGGCCGVGPADIANLRPYVK